MQDLSVVTKKGPSHDEPFLLTTSRSAEAQLRLLPHAYS
jgi:hypothetical protein